MSAQRHVTAVNLDDDQWTALRMTAIEVGSSATGVLTALAMHWLRLTVSERAKMLAEPGD